MPACGVSLVETVDPYNFALFHDGIARSQARPGVNVVIARHPVSYPPVVQGP